MTGEVRSVPSLAVVSRRAHGRKRWRRHSDYQFAASHPLAPLVSLEAGRAAMSLPIGFLKVSDGFSLVALLGLQSDQNLFVAPDGRWLGGYVPAVFRAYPFRIIDTGGGETALGVVDDERFITQGGEGEPFFDDEEGNTPSPALQPVVALLQQLAQAGPGTAAAAGLLAEHNLLIPWSIPVVGRETPLVLQGLFKVNEAALNILPAVALCALRDKGALALAYTQLVSLQHVATLGMLAQAHAEAQAATAAAARKIVDPKGELDLEFLNQGQVLDFRGLT